MQMRNSTLNADRLGLACGTVVGWEGIQAARNAEDCRLAGWCVLVRRKHDTGGMTIMLDEWSLASSGLVGERGVIGAAA